MKYALITEDNGEPFRLWIESKDGLKFHGPIENAEDKADLIHEEEAMKRFEITTVEEAVGSGYSYYNIEIGEYSGEAKIKIDKIISKFEKL